jgi:hypothetical protein
MHSQHPRGDADEKQILFNPHQSPAAESVRRSKYRA